MSDLISPAELRQQQNATDAPTIIDVRGPSEFAGGHVLGAVNIPLSQLAKKLKKVSREREVVTYCNMHHRGESRGERAATLLRGQGFQARAIDGGYPAWQEAGMPTEVTPRAKPAERA